MTSDMTPSEAQMRPELNNAFHQCPRCGLDYFIATKQLSTRRIGTRVLIPIEDVRKFARSDHPERMAG